MNMRSNIKKTIIFLIIDILLLSVILFSVCACDNNEQAKLGEYVYQPVKEQLRKEKDKKVKAELEKKKKAEAEKKKKEEAAKQKQQESSGYVSPSTFKTQGVIYANGIKYTWYSEKVLPGGGLNIPGRHVNGNGYVCDGDGYICVSSCDYAQGTVLSTPFGPAKVYDVCPTSGIVDVYVSW